ncbi:IQ domain-containing protein D-like [Copidosoma floridanum]|uniref:IQ domain-containing protein D-like n=1 Tax=Copidosoma floridanum TaxID=29053 RepID=UPI0006C9BDCA|nr:IQ domain-containing protein D-like [Copidosoma floridanum]
MTRDNEDFRRNYELIVDRVGLLRGIAEHRMKLTPDQLRARKVELRNAEATIIELSERIESLETSYAEETLRYESAMEKSRGEIADLSVTISETEERRGKEFERKIKNCEARLLVLVSDAREDASNAENQLRAHERMLDELTRVHLEQEKLLREQCKVTENKRQAARKAYDEDLTALNELRDKLAEQLRSVAASYETLKNEHDALADLHARLKSERELAIMRVFAEQLEHFEKSRAARLIQRTWRAYRQRAQAARKKKKTRRAKS